MNVVLQETADYETVQNLEYLDMVISEALRLYPPATRYNIRSIIQAV